MAVYSHSKISAFEQCPLKYKFRYIDKIIVIEKSIEAFLGKVVHSALEWLYLQVKKNSIPQIDDVLICYKNKWQQGYDEKVIIINSELSKEDYFNKGIKFITDYYFTHFPFDDNTLETEKEILIYLDEQKEYQIRGFIDRLVYNLGTGEYEIHDYKTSNSMPSQEKIQNDRQLSLYSIAIKELFGEDKDVLLVWHYLAYNQRLTLKKTKEQLEELKKKTLDVIKKIESEKEFPACVSKLCNWCEYRDMCPAWANNADNFSLFRKEKQKEL
jgi:putative RecB family exonuclease